MLALRIAGILVVLIVAGSVVVFFLTRDRRYLRFGFQVFKYALIFALLVFGLMILERALMLA
jgi:predicted signal transduction protein with EAL and GGDEF domain